MFCSLQSDKLEGVEAATDAQARLYHTLGNGHKSKHSRTVLKYACTEINYHSEKVVSVLLKKINLTENGTDKSRKEMHCKNQAFINEVVS